MQKTSQLRWKRHFHAAMSFDTPSSTVSKRKKYVALARFERMNFIPYYENGRQIKLMDRFILWPKINDCSYPHIITQICNIFG